MSSSKKDTVTKDYMKNTTAFADAFNGSVFHGEQIVDPKRLQLADSTQTAIVYNDVHLAAIQKYRDLLKQAVIMRDDNAAYLMLGIENQSDIHYAMPVRNMLYDALQYTDQVAAADHAHREEAKEKKQLRERKEAGETLTDEAQALLDAPSDSSAEFLSGFHKTDRLIPVITLVILFNAAPWDGPLSIHEMLDTQDEEILSLVPDYRIHLISPATMELEDFDRFRTNLREIFLYIKHSKDKKVLKHILSTDTRFKALEREAAVLINTVTGSQLPLDTTLEVTDMCKAIEDIKEEARLEGRLQDLKNLMNNLKCPLNYAMDVLGIPEAERDTLADMINQ